MNRQSGATPDSFSNISDLVPSWYKPLMILHWLFVVLSLLALMRFRLPWYLYLLIPILYLLADNGPPWLSSMAFVLLNLGVFVATLIRFGFFTWYTISFAAATVWYGLSWFLARRWLIGLVDTAQASTPVPDTPDENETLIDSRILAIMRERKELFPFTPETIGYINPYTNTPIQSEADYNAYLLSLALDTFQLSNQKEPPSQPPFTSITPN